MTGSLTTHVLDIAQGTPASGVVIDLWRLDAVDGRSFLRSARTNADGRTETPLLQGEEFEAGTYELLFHVGAYFSTQLVETAMPPFLNLVPVRFSIADSNLHYHVPLLASPWSYSTYRGS